jgi:glycosyltransferase involved in cell wall biosynthesis
MIQKPVSLSIFFPAFNEDENIIPSIEKAIEVAEHSPFIDDYEIIVVNDGSKDGTKKIVTDYTETHSQVRLITHAHNRGYGAALITGLQSAEKEYVFFTDADLQFDLTEINSLLIQVTAGDLVIGYRAPRRDPFMRILNAAGWNTLNRLLFGLKVRDIDCAFKLFPTKLVQKQTYVAMGAMTSAEILIRLTRSGASVKEVPVSHFPRVAGSPTGAKLSVILRAFREMIQLYAGDLGLVTQKQALRFMSVGVINTGIDFVVYILLTRIPVIALSITAAKFLSFLSGTISSFILNRTWTFQIQSKVRLAEIIRFYSVVSISLVVNIVVMSFLTNVLGIYDLVALLLTTVFTFAASFTLSKAWVFIKETPRQNLPTAISQNLSPKSPRST